MKAYFLQRMIAYFIDVLIIGLVSVLFTFWIPISKNYDAALQNLKTTTEQYINNEISEDVFLDLSNEYNYIMQKENFVIELVQLIVILGYVGTYSYYKDGKTIGKKVMKIKVSLNNDHTLSHSSMIIRTLLIHGVFTNLLSSISVLLLSKNNFYVVDNVLGIIQSIFVISSLFMIMFRKDGRGLHDLISNTKVIVDK